MVVVVVVVVVVVSGSGSGSGSSSSSSGVIRSPAVKRAKIIHKYSLHASSDQEFHF